MCLIRFLILFGHLYVTCVWVGVGLRTDTKIHMFNRVWTTYSKFVNHCSFNYQLNWVVGGGGLHDHFMALALLALKNHSNNVGDQKIPQIVAKISYHIHTFKIKF